MIDIDTPDFDQALSASRDGSFHRAVQAYLDRALVDLRGQLQRGLSPLEFEQARKIEAAIEKAGDVVRFSSQSR
jgi:hypothetical protein